MYVLNQYSRLTSEKYWYILIYTMFLYRIVEALSAAKVRFAIAGGYAVALHGAVRGTVDIDLIIKLKKKDYIAAESALKTLGLTSRLPVSASDIFEFRQEYMQNRNLIAWSFVNTADPTQVVDILIPYDLSQLKVKNMEVAGHTLPVLSRSDLIAMKKASSARATRSARSSEPGLDMAGSVERGRPAGPVARITA
jgi:hypothetical protein